MKMNKTGKSLLSMLLVLIMVFGMIPHVSAADETRWGPVEYFYESSNSGHSGGYVLTAVRTDLDDPTNQEKVGGAYDYEMDPNKAVVEWPTCAKPGRAILKGGAKFPVDFSWATSTSDIEATIPCRPHEYVYHEEESTPATYTENGIDVWICKNCQARDERTANRLVPKVPETLKFAGTVVCTTDKKHAMDFQFDVEPVVSHGPVELKEDDQYHVMVKFNQDGLLKSFSKLFNPHTLTDDSPREFEYVFDTGMQGWKPEQSLIIKTVCVPEDPNAPVPENVITEVALTGFTAPVYGAHPDFDLSVPEGAHYHLATKEEMKNAGYSDIVMGEMINGVGWNWTLELSTSAMKPKHVFDDTRKDAYYMCLSLFADEGYEFARKPSITFNGEALPLRQADSDQTNMYIVSQNFTVTDPDAENKAKVTFKVENGTWAEGSKEDKTLIVHMKDKKGTLPAELVPSGMKPDLNCIGGAWDVTPDTSENAITGDVTYTYRFERKTAHTVTFKVVYGTWADGTTADKTVQVPIEMQNMGTLNEDDIPTGMKPAKGYRDGKWDNKPSIYFHDIRGDVTYTYIFEPIPVLIDEVAIYNFREPEFGKNPDFTVSIPGDAHYHLAKREEVSFFSDSVYDGCLWRGPDYSFLTPDSIINDTRARQYYMNVILIADWGYEFADDVQVTINGSNELYSYSRKEGEKELVVGTKTFTIIDPATVPNPGRYTYISQIALTGLTEPVYGAHPDYSLDIPQHAHYHFATRDEIAEAGYIGSELATNGMWWQDEQWYVADTFGYTNYPDEYYYAEVLLIPDPGYVFAENPTVTINGRTDLVNLDRNYGQKPWWNYRLSTVDFYVPYPEVTVTFKVVNGTWDGKDTADKTVKVSLTDGKGALTAEQIPTGMRADAGYEGGTWDVSPSSAEIRGNVTYTYTFDEIPRVENEAFVTLEIVGGTWDGKDFADKLVKVPLVDGKGRLTADQIPTGMVVCNSLYFTDKGEWWGLDSDLKNPLDQEITGDMTISYHFFPANFFRITPDRLKGGGRVEIRLGGAFQSSVTCDDPSVVITPVQQLEDYNVCYAELPDVTKDYVFTARCLEFTYSRVVSVTASDAPDVEPPETTFTVNFISGVPGIEDLPSMTVTTTNRNAEFWLPEGPSRPGYKFLSWIDNEDETLGRVLYPQFYYSLSSDAPTVNLYASWRPLKDTDTVDYTVKHMLEKLDAPGTFEEVTADTETLSGKVGADTAAQARTYEGFTAQQVPTKAIAADGSTVVEIQYTRNIHTLTWDFGDGSAPEGYTQGQVPFGTPIVVPVPTKTGFTFDGWTTAVADTMPDADVTYTAKWTAVTPDPDNPDPVTVNYTVRHMVEKLGTAVSFEQKEAEPLSGIAGADTKAAAKTYEGFTAQAVTQQKIAADGSTVVEIQYTRNIHTLTWDFQYGGCMTQYTQGEVPFGTPIVVPTPSKIGYTFDGWKPAVPETMPDKDLTFTAQWVEELPDPTRAGYTVKHMQEKLGTAGNFEESGIDHFFGTIGENTAAKARDYSGFTAQPVTQAEIKADGSTVVEIKYTRNVHTLTWDFQEGTPAEGAYTKGDVPFGTSITAPVLTKEGFTFDGWDPAVPESMPDSDVTCTAKWTAVTPDPDNPDPDNPDPDNPDPDNPNPDNPNPQPTTANYTVRHMKEKLGTAGNFEQFASDNLTGTIGEDTVAVARTEEGFTAQTVTQAKIAADGSTVVEIKYTRNIHTLTWDFQEGTPAEGAYTKGDVPFGTSITAPVLTKEGFTFDGWEPAVAENMPDSDVTYVAQWTTAVHTHKLTKVEGCEATPGSDGWKSYYECSCGKYFEDENGTKEIGNLQEWKQGDGKIPALGYKFLEGMNASWQQNSKKDLRFRANGDLDCFVSIEVDGNTVDRKDYTVESGSTIVNLKNSYLQKLKVGTHTLKVNFVDGECETQFKISPAPSTPKPVSPKTGDESHLLMWSLISMVSLAAAIVVSVPRKKHEN